MGSEKFCLRWNDFENNISSAFRELRDDKDFFDVTLACDDEQIQAHKVILSACSPFFRNILRRNPHQNPLLYLKGVKYTDLQSVLNFMYHGEVNVAQEELNSFLAVAEDLRVKGLTQNQSTSSQSQYSTNKRQNDFQPRPKSPNIKHSTSRNEREHELVSNVPKPRPRAATQSVHQQAIVSDEDIQEVVPIKSEPKEPVPVQNVYEPRESLQQGQQDNSLTTYQEEEAGYEDYGMEQYETVDQQYEMGHPMQGVDQGKGREFMQDYVKKRLEGNQTINFCTICGKSNSKRYNVLNHVESAHFPNMFEYPCEYCGHVFKSQNSYKVHLSTAHKNK